ncbi:hypothetical protein K8R78_08175, partial [bacterium]|nr:hypothetical protein [bacterium]
SNVFLLKNVSYNVNGDCLSSHPQFDTQNEVLVSANKSGTIVIARESSRKSRNKTETMAKSFRTT